MAAPEPDRCERCNYGLDGLGRRGRCPECGLRFDHLVDLYPEGWRRWSLRRRLLNHVDLAAAIFMVIVLGIIVGLLIQKYIAD